MALPPLHWRRYAAECLGTAILTFAVLRSLPEPGVTPVIAGIVLMLAVYILGPVSGAHVNPAVTVALWSIKKIKASEALAYVTAQLVGAVAAQFLFLSLMDGLPPVMVTPGWSIALAEALGAFFLLLGIAAVVNGKVHSAASGLVIGCSLLLGILLASLMSNGVLNPAVAIGIRSLSLSYLIGPFIGAVAAVYLYQWMTKE